MCASSVSRLVSSLGRCRGCVGVFALFLMATTLSIAHDATAEQDASTPFVSAWPHGIERIWIGPEYWANRLQDWTLRDGRAVCVEGGPRFPLRTLHLLTLYAAREPGALHMRVRIGLVENAPGEQASGFAGFLLGAGGEHVDYRLTALVHHRPAEDGGLLAVVDPSGRVALYDNSQRAAGAGNQWSVAGALAENELIEIEPGVSAFTTPSDITDGNAFDLELDVEPRDDGGAYQVTLRARQASSGAVLSEAVYSDIDPGQIDGGVALISHLGVDGSGYAFENWQVSGTKVRRDDTRAFGPVLCTQYTVANDTLNLTAQMGPLGVDDSRRANLQIRDGDDDAWRTIDTASLAPDSYTFHFRANDYTPDRDRQFRVRYDLLTGPDSATPTYYTGVIRGEPSPDDPFVIASLNCNKIFTGGLRWNHNAIWFPHNETVSAVAHHDPDLLFFAGDQIYEGDLDPAQRNPEDKAILDYLNKWYRWCWSFGELTRRTPTVTIPDDHDVYHGNVWGAGGKHAKATEGMSAQDAGGYRMSPPFVNAVHRTQTGHLPTPYDPNLIGDGYSTYYTTMNYGGVSFAILADRQFKSAPAVTVPDGKVVNGWFHNPDFDPARESDVPGAVLLGVSQLGMLREWSQDFADDVWMKVVLSQTPFTNIATIPQEATSGSVIPSLRNLPSGEYPAQYKLAADTDSNGWPQTGRNRALREFRRCLAIHLAGDQHLGSLIEYGIDEWRDAGFAFTSPAIANTWPRRWFPPEPGLNREPDSPPYTGDFLDGFGNHMTVYAVSNPFLTGLEPANLYDRVPGYGIVRLSPTERTITFECWPRWVEPSQRDAAQYPGWPRTIHQRDNHHQRSITGWLPRIEVPGAASFVMSVINEAADEIEYTLRVDGSRYTPPVYGDGPYTIRVGDNSSEPLASWSGLTPAAEAPRAVLRVR